MSMDVLDFGEVNSLSKLEEAKEWKQKGNDLFKEQNLEGSLTAYEKGVECLIDHEINGSIEIRLALHSNIGLVLFNLERYDRAIEECNKALDVDPKSIKVLLRRALSRERISPPDLLGAFSDLKDYMKYRNDCTDALGALARIESKMRSLDDYNHTSTSSEKIRLNKPMHLDFGHIQNDMSADYQRDTVLKLLDQSFPIRTGEAYFIISFDWWENWCAFTNFFDQLPKSNNSWYHYLKPIKPPKKMPTNPQSDLDSLSSDDSCDNTQFDHYHKPSIIDNTFILNPFNTRKSKFYTLRPFLLRGYHFEALPREAYAALRFWYGEKSPSICRRIILMGNQVKLSLNYPHVDVVPPNSNFCAICQSVSTLRCSSCSSIYYCSRECQISHWPYHKQYCSHRTKTRTSGINSISRTQWMRSGLNNLGNTCFLNSAIQCMSHVKALSLYFLTSQYVKDINQNNPLGAGGGLAKSYDKIIKDLVLGSFLSVSPTALKRAIALYAPRFAGCHQHDAQEFLAYLLDGLHEDLNRVKEKKYVEMPDVDGRREDMQVAGAEAWDAFKRRNDSMVMDTFYGQFKSTCICPQCNKVSVSFDSFNHISLEIPQDRESNRIIPIVLFRSNSRASISLPELIPTRFSIIVNKNGSVFDLKVQLEKKCGISRTRMIIGDIYENSVYDIMQDNMQVCKIRVNDILFAYEVETYRVKCVHLIGTHFAPCNTPQTYENYPVKSTQLLKLEKFGYPLISNFDLESSCEKVWEHLWNQVSRYIFFDRENIDIIQYANQVREHFCIRVVDQNGNPRPLFSDSINKGSLLPRYSSDPICEFLGKDSLDNFLFFSFEWHHLDSIEFFQNERKKFEYIFDHPTFNKQQLPDKKMNLYRCFSTFTKPERLDEENKWYCPTCKDHVRAMKTMQLWNLPDVLVIHLKRFNHKHTRMKLETFVDFPTRNLDLNSYLASISPLCGEVNDHFVKDQLSANYNLLGVINHYGKMGFGHYTAFAKEWSQKENTVDKWRLFDDSKVREVRDEAVVSPAAYVLFYERAGL